MSSHRSTENSETQPPCSAISVLQEFFQDHANLLSGDLVFWHLSAELTFSRPELEHFQDPYIVFSVLSYIDAPSTASAMKGFQAVYDYTRIEEAGTLSYNVFRNESQTDQLHTLEIYESSEYLWDVHAASASVQQNMAAQKDIRIDRDLRLLKIMGGYLYQSK